MSTPGKMAREVGGAWEPKFPDVAIDQTRTVGEITAPEIWQPKFAVRGTGWIPAPPDSHLLSFSYDDARLMLKMKHENGSHFYRSPSELPYSRIHVRFKAKGRAPVVEYTYYSKIHDLLARIWQLLKSADHPGKIVHSHLEQAAGISYHQGAVGGSSYGSGG